MGRRRRRGGEEGLLAAYREDAGGSECRGHGGALVLDAAQDGLGLLQHDTWRVSGGYGWGRRTRMGTTKRQPNGVSPIIISGLTCLEYQWVMMRVWRGAVGSESAGRGMAGCFMPLPPQPTDRERATTPP